MHTQRIHDVLVIQAVSDMNRPILIGTTRRECEKQSVKHGS